jgi:hypothetical protein
MVSVSVARAFAARAGCSAGTRLRPELTGVRHNLRFHAACYE